MTQIGISRGEGRKKGERGPPPGHRSRVWTSLDQMNSVRGQARCSVLDLASRHSQISLWGLGKEGSGSIQDGTGQARAAAGHGWLGGEWSAYQEPKVSANSEHGRWV